MLESDKLVMNENQKQRREVEAASRDKDDAKKLSARGGHGDIGCESDPEVCAVTTDSTIAPTPPAPPTSDRSS